MRFRLCSYRPAPFRRPATETPSERLSGVVSVLLLLFCIVSYYLINTDVPFFSDDLHCLYRENGQRMTGLADAFSILGEEYLRINGRLIPDLLVKIAVFEGDAFFNVFNTLMMVLLLWMLLRVTRPRHADRRLLCLAELITGLFLLSTGIDSLYYWASGSSNYLWTLIPTLLFLQLLTDARPLQRVPTPFVVLLGVVLALQHEMYACPVVAAMVVWLVLRRPALDGRTKALMAGYVVGMAVVVASPGNFGRADAYTFGLGAVARVVKIAYSLRLFYVLLALLAVSFCANRKRTRRFVARNLLLFLLLPFTFVIPFLAASGSRAVFSTDVFSLILIVRLTDELALNRYVRDVAALLLTVFFIWFQGSIVHDSHIKWHIYRQTVADYCAQRGPQVVMDDYQSSNGLIEYYTVNLNNAFMPNDKANQLALMKYRLEGIKAEDEARQSDYIRIVPTNMLAMLDHWNEWDGHLRKINDVGFRRTPLTRYDVMPYDSVVMKKISEGYLYALYDIPLVHKRLKINYLKEELQLNNTIYTVRVKGRQFILSNKKYKHYPFIQLVGFYFNCQLPTAKIEVMDQ
jgi:hypothetical protein